jgi:hypothetical protein
MCGFELQEGEADQSFFVGSRRIEGLHAVRDSCKRSCSCASKSGGGVVRAGVVRARCCASCSIVPANSEIDQSCDVIGQFIKRLTNILGLINVTDLLLKGRFWSIFKSKPFFVFVFSKSVFRCY